MTFAIAGQTEPSRLARQRSLDELFVYRRPPLARGAKRFLNKLNACCRSEQNVMDVAVVSADTRTKQLQIRLNRWDFRICAIRRSVRSDAAHWALRVRALCRMRKRTEMFADQALSRSAMASPELVLYLELEGPAANVLI